MKFLTLTALTAFAMKVAAQGGIDAFPPADIDMFEHEVVCETSDKSPYLHHVDQLVDGLRGERDRDVCFNQNVGRRTGLKCGATIREYSGDDGGAAFQMCKTKKVDGPKACRRNRPGKVSCKKCDGYSAEHISYFIGTLKKKCESNDRAGGKVVFKEGGELRLYSMPG